jgi:hypothetical protein
MRKAFLVAQVQQRWPQEGCGQGDESEIGPLFGQLAEREESF